MSLLQMFTATPAAPFAWSLVLSGGSVVASIIPLGAARSAANFEIKDMAAPRAMFDRFPVGASVPAGPTRTVSRPSPCMRLRHSLALLAVTQGADLPATAVVAAFAQPFLRLACIAAYVGNVPPARGLCWASGLLCTGILYSEGLMALINN